ncbi:carbohydrate porin [Pseudoroseomonas wenyumeiae]
MPVSSAEALSTLRLSELWLERRFDGVASVRFGQLAADAEFFTAEATEHLTNGTFGWPLGMSTALPSGGPAYPLSAPGIRLELGDPSEDWGLRLAVFSEIPEGDMESAPIPSATTASERTSPSPVALSTSQRPP